MLKRNPAGTFIQNYKYSKIARKHKIFFKEIITTKKYQKLENINLIVDVLIIIFLFTFRFGSEEIEHITQISLFGIIIFKNAVLGIVLILKEHKKNWKTAVLIVLYILQIIVYISDIITKNYQPQRLCIITLAPSIFQNYLL